MTMRSILRLLHKVFIIVDGENVIEMSQDQLSNMRGRDVSMIFKSQWLPSIPFIKWGIK